MIAGRLTRDPEIRHTTNNTALAKFSLAVTQKFESGGEWKEETSFFDCIAWGKQAELAGEYLRQGSTVHVEGRLKQESWEDKETRQRRSKIVVVTEKMQFVPRADGAAQGGTSAAPRQAPGNSAPAARSVAPYRSAPPVAPMRSSPPPARAPVVATSAPVRPTEDDIPF